MPIVLWTGRRSQGENLFRHVRNKQLLASNTDALPAITHIHCCRMHLQPGSITLVAPASRPDCGEFLRISNLFHDELVVAVSHTDPIMWEGIMLRLWRMSFDM